MATHSMEKKTKLAESGIVNVDCYGLTTHAHAIGEEIDGRYPPSQDQSTENAIYPNEIVWIYDTYQPHLVQAKGKYQVADDGLRYVFSTINRMPGKAHIIPFGVSMGTFQPNDKATWRLSVAIEGTFSVPNTGDRPFQVGDFVCGDVPPLDTKDPVRVGKHQRGRMYPVIFPLSSIKSQFEDVYITVQKEMDILMEKLEADAKKHHMSIKDTLKVRIAELRSSQWAKCFSALQYLDETTKSTTGNKVMDKTLLNCFSTDCLEMIRNFDIKDHETFFSGVLLNALSIFEWMHENDTLLSSGADSRILLQGKLMGRLLSCGVFYDQEVFQHLRTKVFAFAMSDSKVGERVDIFVGRT